MEPIEIANSLLWFGAKAKWPELTVQQFKEAGLAAVVRMGMDGATIMEMSRLLEAELVQRHGQPAKR